MVWGWVTTSHGLGMGNNITWSSFILFFMADFSVMSGSGQVPGVQLAERLYSTWMVCGEIHCLSTKVGAGGGRWARIVV